MKSLIFFIFVFGMGYFVGSQSGIEIMSKFKPVKFDGIGKQNFIELKNKLEKKLKEQTRKPASDPKQGWFYLKNGTTDDNFDSVENARCKVSKVSVYGGKKLSLHLFCQGAVANQEILRKQIISKYKI